MKAILGQGGMGVVYHAYDTLMRRDVALKTLRDVPTGVFLDLFARECGVLAAMVHPNVVEVFDMGEFEDEGMAKPYFVMPLLPGGTLYDLIYPSAIPLSTTRCVDIISQVCRGLQAAHERDLLHRDIKPRNIFVMRDDAVKIIDFGVAHLLGGNSTGVRGTTEYMSPEQITFKQLDNRSDIFSLAVVCYEALTASHPFRRRGDKRDTEAEIVEAITSYIPPLVSDLNPSVNRSLSQVVAKGMAKDVWNRHESAAAFAEALQKALRNETSNPNNAPMFARLERARRSFEQNDLQFASEIITQLEAEGWSDPGISSLRQELDEAVLRERTERLIVAANRCCDDEEYTLALRKIQEILEIDAANSAALKLRARIENVLTDRKVNEFLALAAEHLNQSQFTNARQAVQDALKLRPADARARQFLSEVDAKQKEVLRRRQEQERIYQAAQAAFFAGKIELAIENLDHLERLTSQSNEIRDRTDDYKELYRRVMAEHEVLKTALAQAHGLLDHDLTGAQKICDRHLAKYAGHPGFIDLGQEITKRRAEEEENFRKSVATRVESEASLDARLSILEEALKKRPTISYFDQEIRNTRELAKKLAVIADQARVMERNSDYSGAMAQWESIGALYPRFPRLGEEISRAQTGLDQQRAERKADLSSRIESALLNNNHDQAGSLIEEAEREFPGDENIGAFRLRRNQQVERAARVVSLIEKAREATRQKQFTDTIALLVKAGEASGEDLPLKTKVFQASLDQSEDIAAGDWRAAKEILQFAAQLAPQLTVPADLWKEVLRREQDEDVHLFLALAAVAEREGDLSQARDILQQALEKYAEERRLQASLAAVAKAILEKRREEDRVRDLASLQALHIEFREAENVAGVRAFRSRSNELAEKYGEYPAFTEIALEISTHAEAFELALAALSQGDVQKSFRICDDVLAAHPGHRLFLRLRTQVEATEREQAAEFVKQTTQQLASEPDLHNRRTILEEALRRYPNEQYLAEELALVRNKEQLIEEIAGWAKGLEDNGFASEALEQWTELKGIYPSYAGVDAAIARCNRLIERKRAELRDSLRAGVTNALENQDYDTAAKRLLAAQSEFPGDAEFVELAQLIEQRRQLRDQSLALVKKAAASLRSGQFKADRRYLLEALKAAENEPAIAKNIATTLIRDAGKVATADLTTAEAMVMDARAVDPTILVPPEIEKALHSARRKREFEVFQSAAQPLEKNRDFTEALHLCREFLIAYPGDSEAEAERERLLQAIKENENRQKRQEQLTQIGSFKEQAKKTTPLESLLDLAQRTKQVGRQDEVDAELTKLAENVGQVISTMAEIRKLIDQGQLDEAEAKCAKALAEFPSDPVFEHWRADIKLRQVERASEYLRQTEQKLSLEPDFDKQQQILQEALRAYPRESFYSDELSLVRDKQLLLDAELTRARDLESRLLLEDAVREWEGILRAYPWYPGIDGQVERVRMAWVSKRDDLRKLWSDRIHERLAVRDADSASALLREAFDELPGDEVLKHTQLELENLKQALARRSGLLAEGEEFFGRGLFPEGVELFKSAVQVLPDDVAFRDWVLNLMSDEAKSAIESNWQTSEILLNGIRQIDSQHAIPGELQEAVQDRRAEAALVHLCEEVDRRAAEGSLAALREAKHLLDSGAARFPGAAPIDRRQEEIAAKIRQLIVQQGRDQAARQATELRSQLRTIRTKRQLSKLQALSHATLLGQSEDSKVRTLGEALVAEIETKTQELDAAPQSNFKRFWYVPIALIVLLGALLGGWWHRRQPLVGPAEVTKVAIPPAPIPAIQVTGNIASADVSLDGSKVGDLSTGLSELSHVSPGSHVLNISSSEGDASIPILQDAIAGPRVSGVITTHRISVAAISANGAKATLTTSTLERQTVFVDKRMAGSTANGSLILPALSSGDHQIRIGPPSDAVAFDLAITPRPSLYVLIAGNSASGTLSISTNVSDADLFINGKKYPAASAPLFLVLPTKAYEIYATHDGYENSNAAHIDLAKGAQEVVSLRLTPKPGKLEITTRLPGTKLALDGHDMGELRAGTTSSKTIPAGSHSIEISRQGFISKRLTRVLEPGHTLILAGADLELSAAGLDAEARAQEDWKRAKASGSLAALQDFREQHPSGPNTQTAADMIQQLEWDAVDKSNVAALNAYTTKYPGSAHANDARHLVEQLAAAEKNKAEQSQWDALDKSKKEDIRSFLDKYPNGSHANAAERMLADIDKQQKLADQEATDEAAWKAVNRADRTSLERYLAQFPAGKHANQSQQMLDSLAQRQQPPAQVDSAAVLAVLQQYAAAWSAKDIEGILKLQPSLSRRKLKSDLEPVKVWQMSITPLSAPQVNGDHAEVTCRRNVSQVFSDGTARQAPESTVVFVLRKQGTGWIVEQIR